MFANPAQQNLHTEPLVWCLRESFYCVRHSAESVFYPSVKCLFLSSTEQLFSPHMRAFAPGMLIVLLTSLRAEWKLLVETAGQSRKINKQINKKQQIVMPSWIFFFIQTS